MLRLPGWLGAFLGGLSPASSLFCIFTQPLLAYLPTNPAGLLPDLFDARPIMLHARYRPPTSGSIEGTVEISGNTGSGPYRRRIPVTFSHEAPEHASIATLWARARVDEVLTPHLLAVEQGLTPPKIKEKVIEIGEGYSIVTPFTSFVAVEKSKVVVEGRSMLVTVPIELPDGTDWEGIFGDDCPFELREKAMEFAGIELEMALEDLEDGSRPVLDAIADSAPTPPPAGASAKQDQRWFGRGVDGAVATGNLGSPVRGKASVPPPSGRPVASSKVRSPSASRSSRVAGAGRGFGSGGGGIGGRQSLEAAVGSRGGVFGSGGAAEAEIAGLDIDASLADQAGDVGVVVEGSLEQSAPEPVRDFNRIARTIDRRLLMLILGVRTDDIEGIPTKGLDGRPWIDGSTIEVTILLDKDASLSLKTIEDLGLVIEGRSMVGGSALIVGRIDLDRILDLGETGGIRRVVPATGS